MARETYNLIIEKHLYKSIDKWVFAGLISVPAGREGLYVTKRIIFYRNAFHYRIGYRSDCRWLCEGASG
jgi:hypothetical protein